MKGHQYYLDNNFADWNPKDFNWHDGLDFLFRNCNNYFDVWFNPEYVDVFENSFELGYFCEDYFLKWWDKDKFNYHDYSYLLAKKFNAFFDIWWDSQKFNWDTIHINNLINYCLKDINVWWDVEKVVKNASMGYVVDLLDNKLPEKERLKLKLLTGI